MTTEDERGAPDLTLALRGLVDFARKHDRELLGRPSRIEVAQPALAAELDTALDDRDTTVVAVHELPNVRDVLRHLEEHNAGGAPVPVPLLESPGVTLEGLRGFADAAAHFYNAHVWHALDPDEDLVTVESPVVDPALQHVAVTGSTPALRGLTFFSSPKQFEKILKASVSRRRRPPSVWMIGFGQIDELPFGDVDAWLDHDLPVAGPDAYPRPQRIGPGGVFTRPDATRLHYLEAVLRALAESSEEDFDAGRWTRRVSTSQGAVHVRIALPRLLDALATDRRAGAGTEGYRLARLQQVRAMRRVQQALEDTRQTSPEDLARLVDDVLRAAPETAAPPELGPATSLDEAQALAYDAIASRGRYQLRRAREALALSRDCVDAWLTLASRAPDTAAEVSLYREAVAAGARALAPLTFDREAGRFWTLPEARPGLRARLALADALEADGQEVEALAEYRELIRLDAGDHQGVRYRLLALLLRLSRDEDAERLLGQFDADENAEWLYAGALVSFRTQAPDAAARLARALAANPHVPPFLLGERAMPAAADAFQPGSVEEAILVAYALTEPWTATPGAELWLKAMRLTRRTRRPRSPSARPRST
jgi:tetratricopeptide (TPR) repeat protein